MLLAEGYELLHSTVAILRDNKDQFNEAFEGLRRTLKGTGDFFDKNGSRLDRITANVEQITIDGDDAVKSAKSKFVENPQVDRILENVDKVTTTAAKDMPPIVADAKETLANAKRISATVGGESEQAKIKQAISDVSEIASRAKVATTDAETIVAHIKRGKGTVGAVVMDEQLYDDLQEMVRDLKHNPWKFFWRE
jgi:phospholipid/cholesterol/gamma-HCH transport system substrate-binding protein